MTFYHFDNFGAWLGVLKDVSVAKRTFSVTRSHTMDIVSATPGEKADRIVFRDPLGTWHEYYVLDCEESDETGTPISTYDLEWSMQAELSGDPIDKLAPTGTPAQVMTQALSGSRWEVGVVNVPETEMHFSWSNQSAWQALREVMNEAEGELQPDIVVEGGRITHRRVNLLTRMGSDRGKRYVDTRDLVSLSRSRGTDLVYTRIKPLGSAMPVGSVDGDPNGGYSRKITIGDVNGGDDYLADEAARERWGRPDGHGGKAHVTGFPEFENIKEKPVLLEHAKKWFAEQLQPAYSYTAKVVDLSASGLEADMVAEGDDVAVIAGTWENPVRIKERIVKGTIDYVEPENTEYTIGIAEPTLDEAMADEEEEQRQLSDQLGETNGFVDDVSDRTDHAQESADQAQSGVDDLNDRSFDWDKTTDIVDTQPSEWLQECMDRINEEMNNAKTYKFTSFDKGDIWANGPLTKDGRPTGSTSAAIALNGLGFRISSQVRGGEFVWTTFGTGAGFTANCINVGILRCGDNYLNLDTGEMRIAFTAKVGSGNQNFSNYVDSAASSAASSAESRAKSYADNAADAAERAANSHTDTALQDYIQEDAIGDYLTQKAVFNALTNNGQLKGIFMSAEGQLMINGDYLRTGIIEGQNELSLWNLNSGYFETVGHTTSGGQTHTMRCRLANGTLDLRMDLTSIGSAGTYTSSSNANVHSFGLAAFTNLILSSPGQIGVGYSASGSSLSWTAAVRESEIGFLSSANASGSTLTLSKSTASVKHGIITAIAGSGSVTYSAPSASADPVRLVASVEPAADLESGVAIQVRDLCGDEELAEAAEAGRAIWVEDPDAGGLGTIVYTGTEWTGEVPRATDPETVTVAKTAYVDERTDLIQAEIEAIAAEVGGTNLQTKLRAARSALSTGSGDVMASAIRALGE